MDGQALSASAKTQSDAAYAALREAILSCRLEPGAKIKINDAAAEFEFSPGAVREALSRLAAERMAVATAQKGFTVAAISAEELIDLTRHAGGHRATVPEIGDRQRRRRVGGRRFLAAYHRLHRVPISEPASAALSIPLGSPHIMLSMPRSRRPATAPGR